MAKKKSVFNGIDFNNLFRVKGKQGLYEMKAKPNKSGLCAMVAFSDPEKKYLAKGEDLICLGELWFCTEHGHDDLRIKEVLENLHNWNLDPLGLALSLEKIMNKIVPNYDSSKFKEYHAEWVKMWYSEFALKF